MDNTALTQRQRWFRFFPAGSIEFLLVTRILGVFLLLALAAMRASQRPMVLLALGIVLLVDYMLMIWWAVQTASDLEHLSRSPREAAPARSDATDTPDYAGPAVGAAESQWRCLAAAIPACLPALIAFIALVPWPGFADSLRTAAVERALPAVSAVAFVAALFIGWWRLNRIRLGPRLWSFLLLVPFLHWFAMHRLVRHFHEKLNACRRVHGDASTEGPSVALAIADVTWLLAMLPWAILVVAGMSQAVGLTWRDAVAPCGALLTAVFAVADVAALEGLQRQLGGLWKSLDGQRSGTSR